MAEESLSLDGLVRESTDCDNSLLRIARAPERGGTQHQQASAVRRPYMPPEIQSLISEFMDHETIFVIANIRWTKKQGEEVRWRIEKHQLKRAKLSRAWSRIFSDRWLDNWQSLIRIEDHPMITRLNAVLFGNDNEYLYNDTMKKHDDGRIHLSLALVDKHGTVPFDELRQHLCPHTWVENDFVDEIRFTDSKITLHVFPFGYFGWQYGYLEDLSRIISKTSSGLKTKVLYFADPMADLREADVTHEAVRHGYWTEYRYNISLDSSIIGEELKWSLIEYNRTSLPWKAHLPWHLRR